VPADEERTEIGDHRENERYHHLTSYPLMEPRRQSKLLILYADRVLMTHNRRNAPPPVDASDSNHGESNHRTTILR